MHWKCSEIWERKVYWVQFWDLFLDQLNGKILKMAYFFSVSIGVENPEKMCAWKTSLTSFLFSFWKWFFFLSWLWLNYKTFDYTFLKPPFFSFLFAKVIGFSHENCWQEKKKDFRWAMRKINGKLLQLHWCIINRKLKNVQLNPSCSTWKIDGKNRTISCQILFFSSRSWSWLIRSPFFQLLFKHI